MILLSIYINNCVIFSPTQSEGILVDYTRGEWKVMKLNYSMSPCLIA